MSQLSKAAFDTLWADAGGQFADNNTRDIIEGFMRQFGKDLKDSTLFIDDAYDTIQFIIDGGSSAITTGVKGDIRVPFDCTVLSWEIVADVSGSIVVDIWMDTYANFPPDVADTITGSEKPTLSTAIKNQDLTLSTFTTALTRGKWLRYNVDSAATVTRVTISLNVKRTS